MGSRTWIKVYCDRWLEGSISEESIHVRGIWITLLTLAGNGKYGDSGKIMAIDRVGFNDKQLAAMLKVSLKMWVGTKKRLVKTDRIIITEANIISIANWGKYQSEYERTSQYRSKGTTSDTTNGTRREERVENKEKRIENVDVAPSFITYKEKLKVTYPELDINYEWERCQIWYRDHKKVIKSHSLALGNWCKMEAKRDKKGIDKTDPDRFIKGKYGHLVRR